MKNRDPLRKLARTQKYQMLYARSKDMGLKLFKNDFDLSFYQIIFLHWLQIYENLYYDLRSGEKYIDEDVIGNEILEDAYLLWKTKYKDKEEKKGKKKKQSNPLSKMPSIKTR